MIYHKIQITIKQDSYTKAEDEVQKETMRFIDIGLPQGKNKVNSNSKASNSKVCWPWQMQDPATKDGSLSINYGPYKYGGDAHRKFWIEPLKETDLGGAQAFFDL